MNTRDTNCRRALRKDSRLIRSTIGLSGYLIAEQAFSLATRGGNSMPRIQSAAMDNWMSRVLRINYYYGRLIGVINFEIDMARGEPRVTRRATLYAAGFNALTFGLVSLLVKTQIWHKIISRENSLRHYLFLAMVPMRVCCVLVTALSRWRQRARIVQLLRRFRRLVLLQPQVMRLWRRGLMSKCLTGMLTEILQLVLALHSLRHSLTPKLIISMLLVYMLVSWLNVVLAHFYFALLSIHGHYLLINQELRTIMADGHRLRLERCKRLRRRKGSALAARLFNLAQLQSQLQKLLLRMAETYGLQNLCINLIFKITIISGTYYIYATFRNSVQVDWLSASTLLTILCSCFYLADSILTHSIAGYVELQYAEMRQLIEQYPTFDHNLDKRVLFAFESFCLQLTRNPQKLTVLGLYSLQRSNVLAVFSSLVRYSLILIQNDIENEGEN